MDEPPNFLRRIPDGEDRERLVCTTCGFIRYENPKIVVGSVATWEGKVLMCRRAIEPSVGRWTLPAGYMELNETPEEGAAREAWEEARATLKIEGLLAIYTIRRISQVQLFYRAELASPNIEAGPESLEVGLFAPDEAAALELAFPSVSWALAHHAQAAAHPGPWLPVVNPPE